VKAEIRITTAPQHGRTPSFNLPKPSTAKELTALQKNLNKWLGFRKRENGHATGGATNDPRRQDSRA
jgi:hypothetical protein